MNRAEFMSRLRELLSDITESEREEALNYYEDYFDEAGAENESSVIQDLVSPEKVAFIIKKDAQGSETGEYTERGYFDGDEEKQTPVEKKKEKRKFPWVLILILAIFALPIWGGLFGGLVGLLAGAVGIVIALLLAAIALTFAGIVGGIAMIVWGAVKVLVSPAVGLLGIGAGAIFLAIGLCFLLLCIWIIGKVIPAIFRFFIDLCQKLLYKIKGGARHE